MLCVNDFENWVYVFCDVKKKKKFIDQFCLFFIDFFFGMVSNNIKSFLDFWYVIFFILVFKENDFVLMIYFECRFLIIVLLILKLIYF